MIGFLSGLVGVGGGIFLSPLLLFLRWGETRVISGVYLFLFGKFRSRLARGYVHASGITRGH